MPIIHSKSQVSCGYYILNASRLFAALVALYSTCTRTSDLKASNSCCSDPSFVCQSVVSMDPVLSLGAAEQQHQYEYEYEYMDMK